MNKERYITLCDGTTMGAELTIIKTNAPENLLRELEEKACEAYRLYGNDAEIPLWYNEVKKMGYTYEYIDSYMPISTVLRLEEFIRELEKKFNIEIAENYLIEDQPELGKKKKGE